MIACREFSAQDSSSVDPKSSRVGMIIITIIKCLMLNYNRVDNIILCMTLLLLDVSALSFVDTKPRMHGPYS